jgi:hypothetical protein
MTGAIDWAKAISSSVDHRVCPRGSSLPNEDGRKRHQIFHPLPPRPPAVTCTDFCSFRLCRRHTPTTGPLEEMANVDGEVWAIHARGYYDSDYPCSGGIRLPRTTSPATRSNQDFPGDCSSHGLQRILWCRRLRAGCGGNVHGICNGAVGENAPSLATARHG